MSNAASWAQRHTAELTAVVVGTLVGGVILYSLQLTNARIEDLRTSVAAQVQGIDGAVERLDGIEAQITGRVDGLYAGIDGVRAELTTFHREAFAGLDGVRAEMATAQRESSARFDKFLDVQVEIKAQLEQQVAQIELLRIELSKRANVRNVAPLPAVSFDALDELKSMPPLVQPSKWLIALDGLKAMPGPDAPSTWNMVAPLEDAPVYAGNQSLDKAWGTVTMVRPDVKGGVVEVQPFDPKLGPIVSVDASDFYVWDDRLVLKAASLDELLTKTAN